MSLTDNKKFQTYLTDLGIDSHDLNTTFARQIFERVVSDYMNKDLSLDSLCNIASELLYSNKLVNSINIEDPELANILTFAAELEWDFDNNKKRYYNSIKKIVNFGSE